MFKHTTYFICLRKTPQNNDLSIHDLFKSRLAAKHQIFHNWNLDNVRSTSYLTKLTLPPRGCTSPFHISKSCPFSEVQLETYHCRNPSLPLWATTALLKGSTPCHLLHWTVLSQIFAKNQTPLRRFHNAICVQGDCSLQLLEWIYLKSRRYHVMVKRIWTLALPTTSTQT